MSTHASLPIDQVMHGDCLQLLASFPAESIDLIFADPPYNLQLRQDLWRPNLTRVDAVNDEWDYFEDFKAYDEFTLEWLTACRRVLKPQGTIWVIGTYHNIFRVGRIIQDLGFWILNDIVWIKVNPMPNFRGVRFTNAHELLIWAQKERGSPYVFNHHAMKALNEGKQMRSDWYLPICSGAERLRVNGEKAHSTQKPESLLYRILLASSEVGDIILDPFFGTGTTGVVAKRLHRHWIGIEREKTYVELARQRIEAVETNSAEAALFYTPNPRKLPRLPIGLLLEYRLLEPGQWLYLQGKQEYSARLLADGSLEYQQQRGSIHQIARLILQAPCNGWEQWYYLDSASQRLRPINDLREHLRKRLYLT